MIHPTAIVICGCAGTGERYGRAVMLRFADDVVLHRGGRCTIVYVFRLNEARNWRLVTSSTSLQDALDTHKKEYR